MLEDLQLAVLGKFTKYSIAWIKLSKDKTKMVVEENWEVIGKGKTSTTAYIMIVGNSHTLLNNKWIITRVEDRRNMKVWCPMSVLSDKTKKELWEFMLAQKDKNGGFTDES